ncbi:uncharacterized protein LOC111408180 isoform X2 [Olea europaea var. sylvestris]|uniref:uncharacterized protein LOC111408180 isoform X2 n=1 Tax=Olea europaea var. sylvestris TaxID=158386 RepID=UPI000C1D7B8B|nr:uncharacterized protein LOC111408180 isoform X2 [Olea europaea var. sylvestris]
MLFLVFFTFWTDPSCQKIVASLDNLDTQFLASKMGSGVWFKNIISKKKVKSTRSEKFKRYSAPEKSKGYKEENSSRKGVPTFANGASAISRGLICFASEDIAAARIQTAFRAYRVCHIPCYVHFYHLSFRGIFLIPLILPFPLPQLLGGIKT